MGEIRIKSGNLALWDKQWLINVSGVVEYDKNVWASIIDVRDINTIYLSGDVTKLNNSIYRIGRFTEYPELGVVGIRSTSLGGVLDVTNYNFCMVSCSLFNMPTTRQDLVDEFMITLGSTPPTEFQPYFLNRPAHQLVNGQCIDIPTHHFINNRWQGELTSQSPLKFWADGEMLDWRIEGKTSGNLLDVNGNIARESSGSIEISENQIIITVSATWGRDYIIYDKVFNPGLYTIKIISSSNTSEAPYSIGFLSTTPLPGWTYNEYYAAYVKDFDKNNTLIIRTTESMRIGFRCSSSQVGQKVTLSNIKLLEGAYIPEGDNLFDGEWKQGTIMSPSSQTRVSNKNVISLKPNTVYTIGLRGSSIIQYALVYRDKDGNVTYDSGWFSTESPVLSPISNGATAEILLRRSDAGSISPVSEEVLSLKVIFAEDTYPSSYEPYGGVGDWDETTQRYRIPVTVNGTTTNLYTDHQLMDGDSIDYATDQTAIPIATGNNTLTVDTAVQPSKVFIKFEG